METPTDTTTKGAYDATKGPDQLATDPAGRRIDVENKALEAENRAKLQASGQIPEGTPEQLANEQTYMATYGVANPQFQSPAITSSVASNEVDTKYRDVQAGLNETSNVLSQPKYQQYQDFTGEIQDQRTANKTAYEARADLIEQDFAIRRKEMEQSNRLETGFQMSQLAKMKAFGVSASAMSLMKSVQVQNEREYTKLMVEKHKLLLGAQEAYLSNDWEMLNEKIEQSQKLTDQINDIQKQTFDDSLLTNKEIREQSRFGWEAEDRAMAKMNTYAGIYNSYEEIPPEDVAKMEAQAGVSEGFLKQYFSLAQRESAMAEMKADLEYQKDLVDMLNKIPSDQSVMIGDEIIQGWDKQTPEYWTTTATDGAGNVTFVSFNKETGVVNTVGLGNIGSPAQGFQLQNIGGQTYRVNPGTGQAELVMTKGGNMDPSHLPGFDQWAQSMGTITTPFGGETGFEASHPGIDIAGPVGTDITAFRGGVVTNMDPVGSGAYGKFVEIRDSEGLLWRYSHLDSVGVTMGATVNPNQYIADMGNTGTGILTKANTGVYHQPTAEERAAGAGSHLDLRVVVPDQPLAAEPENLPKGMTSADMTSISTDMNAIMKGFQEAEYGSSYAAQSFKTDAEREKFYADLYTKTRQQVAVMGQAALTWFDNAYPASTFKKAQASSKTLSEMTEAERKLLTPQALMEQAKSEGVGFLQLNEVYGGLKGYDAKTIVDIAKATGGTLEQVKKLLKDDDNDRWTNDVQKYAKEQLK